jgi:hypothetical protein
LFLHSLVAFFTLGIELTSMNTLDEVKAALPALSPEELATLEQLAREEARSRNTPPRKSWRDIKPVDLGKPLKPLTSDDDIFGEMIDAKRS